MKARGGRKAAKPAAEESKRPNPFPMFQSVPGQLVPSEQINEVMQGLFGYRYNSQMELESNAGTRFMFEGEQHYDALGSYVGAYVHSLLRESCGLTEVWLPARSPHQFCIFQSPDWTTNTNKALVLIPGKGKVTLGQWSRSVCMNDGIAAGSMLNYIIRAAAEGYAVLVMNTNERAPGATTNEMNAEVTWKYCMQQSKAKDVYIVAHSWGGKCTVHLLKSCFPDVSRRVLGISFTDSVHKTVADLPQPARDFFKARAINWIRSARPLDEVVPEKSRKDGCENRSSGTTEHEYTSCSAIDCVFGYLQSCIRRVPMRPGPRAK